MQTSAQTITLVGAGGKMGNRITDNMKDSAHQMYYLEVSPQGIEGLKQKGLSVSKQEEVIPLSDVVIMAVPDVWIGKISAEIVPQMRSHAILMALDPAAPLAGELPDRKDITYVVVHPSHPSVFNHEETEEAQRDFFGGIKAKQTMVGALMQGPEEHYAIGEAIAKEMFAPIVVAHRVTVEQMGILEPAFSETLSATCIAMIREGLDEVIKKGVPPDAARDFILGHIHIQLAILFNELDVSFSDAANKALDRAKSILFKEDWKKIFEPDNVSEQIDAIIH